MGTTHEAASTDHGCRAEACTGHRYDLRAASVDMRRIVGGDAVFDAPLDLALYSHDATLTPGPPELVVLPRTTEQVAAVIRYARERGIPVTPRGCGTSLSGGPVPSDGGIVVSLTRMNAILSIDTANREVRVQPGVVNLDLQNALAPLGFLYAPDPSSQTVCSIGGNVAENAGGPHCLKYGVTANHVTGLEVVLADGEVVRLGSLSAGPARIDPTSVIVGSEGTFCVATEVACRILPIPQAVVTMLAIFDTLEDASRTVSAIIAKGIIPATLEMMDRPLIQAVQIAMDAGYPEDAEAVLIIELDGLQAGMERQLEQVKSICDANAVRRFQWADDEAERAKLWKGRKGTFGAVANISPGKLCSDVAVPRSELPFVLTRVVEMGAQYGLRVGNVFHAGDGNLHPQVLFDPRDPDEVRRAHELDEEIARLAIDRGGVLTGEHGIGTCKRQWMGMMFGAVELDLMWRIKDAFDPTGLMNPGKILPQRGARSQQPPPNADLPSDAASLAPESVEELALCVQRLAAAGSPYRICGAGTKSGAETADGAVLSTARLSSVLQVDPENLTITAQAGVRWADLQAAAGSVGQRVPVFPRCPDRATLGGVLAADDAGPRRFRYGGCRDALLGARFVLSSGEAARFGSRCVKNTSGYAVERLMVGSWGTLGVIAEATLRTLPVPERALTLLLPVAEPGALAASAPSLQAACRDLVAHPLEIAAAELVSPAALARCARLSPEAPPSTAHWYLAIQLEGSTDEVADVAAAIASLLEARGLPPTTPIEGPAEAALWEALTDVPLPAVEIAARPTGAIALAIALSERYGPDAWIRAGIGTGLVSVAQPDRASIADWIMPEAPEGELARWRFMPPRLQYGPETIAPSAGLDSLLTRVKDAFDPHHILPTLI
jgi:D-lactate dehydrogenase (cytochrome)